MKKICLLSIILTYSLSTSAIIVSLGRFVIGGGLLTGAFFAYEETKKEYSRSAGFLSKECSPITKKDFDSGHEKELQEKCYCYGEKYKKVLQKAALTLILGGFGARMVAKGILK